MTNLERRMHDRDVRIMRVAEKVARTWQAAVACGRFDEQSTLLAHWEQASAEATIFCIGIGSRGSEGGKDEGQHDQAVAEARGADDARVGDPLRRDVRKLAQVRGGNEVTKQDHRPASASGGCRECGQVQGGKDPAGEFARENLGQPDPFETE